MDGEVCIPTHDDRLDLAHEEPFAAHLSERAILDAVAFRSNADFLDRELREVALELLADPTGLHERKIAPACGDA
jgi:hypothetical protein